MDDLSEKQLVIDGKRQCGTSPASRGNKGLYILNSWISENSFCIARKKVGDKSDGITAIPEILSDIDMENSVVSIDAMGTQRETAELIVRNKGHYLPAVKENRRHCTRISSAPLRYIPERTFLKDLDAGHGRIETRKCSILPANVYLMDETPEAWKGLSTIIRIETVRETQRQGNP